VRANGRPNVRACRHPVAEGDRVDAGNGWPSARHDLLGAFDLAFPRGVDLLHGFRRPLWLVPWYHRVIRALAGYSAAPDAASAGALTAAPIVREVDVAVVGAGAAGTAAAARLAEAGRTTLVVDRRTGLAPVVGAEVLDGTTVTFLPAPDPPAPHPFQLLGYREPGQGVSIRCRTVIVATGAYDGTLLFGGNDRPGIMGAELACHWSGVGRAGVLGRTVLVGGGARANDVLERLGASVRAVVAPAEVAPEVAARASDLGIPLYPRSLVLWASGGARVRTLHLRTRGGGPHFSIPCDSVVLAHARLPHVQLFFQGGVSMVWRPDPGAYYPRTAPDGVTSVPGLYAVGAAAGRSPAEARASGERAAVSIVANAPPAALSPEPTPDGPGPMDGYYRELLREPRRGKWFACTCEDVLLDEVLAAHARGYRGIEVIKRYTNVGTGTCQGRYCLPGALALLSILEDRPPADVGYITQRPPVVPTPLAALAALRSAVSEGEGR
jgi:sarcosine oxidase subunit alpha